MLSSPETLLLGVFILLQTRLEDICQDGEGLELVAQLSGVGDKISRSHKDSAFFCHLLVPL